MQKDTTLGHQVGEHLKSLGLETPTVENSLTKDQKREIIEGHVAAIMTTLGLDLSDDSLQGTPKRVAKMYVDEIFSGLGYENFPKATAVQNKMGYDEMVVVSDISVQSACEHHLVVISGKAQVAYIPKDKVIGLSKLNRIVEHFARRPQIQERLTEQIFHALCFILETDDVAVTISAEHYCVKSRGVRDEGSFTTTSKLGGVFRNTQARAEFFALSAKR